MLKKHAVLSSARLIFAAAKANYAVDFEQK